LVAYAQGNGGMREHSPPVSNITAKRSHVSVRNQHEYLDGDGDGLFGTHKMKVAPHTQNNHSASQTSEATPRLAARRFDHLPHESPKPYNGTKVSKYSEIHPKFSLSIMGAA
jgi:hypothetical protein